MTAPINSRTDTEALLVHAPFLRALARSLLGAGHPDEPEDVVQEAYLRASTKPPRDVEAGRGWLATVVRRLVAERGRREPRRAAWERGAARREAVPSTDEIVEREAVRRQVVDAVVALDEPYRSVILLRFYEDLPPREIAARLDLPVETVRTRIKRGLAKLQSELDDAHGGDRRAWGIALAPLAWPARAHAVGVVSIPLAVKVLIAAGVLVPLVFQLWKIVGPDTTSPLEESPLVASHVPQAAEPGALVGALQDSPRALDVPVTGARLTFDVVGVSSAERSDRVVALTGVAIADVSDVPTLPASRIREQLETRVMRTDASGRAAFEGVPQGLWVVTTGATHESAQGFHSLVAVLDNMQLDLLVAGAVRHAMKKVGVTGLDVRTVATQGSATVDLDIAPRGRMATGRVVDFDAGSIASADVVALPSPLLRVSDVVGFATVMKAFAPTLSRTTTGTDGAFALPVEEAEAQLHAAAAGHIAARVDMSPSGATTILLRRAAGVTVRGRVVGQDGLPIAHAPVALDDVAPIHVDHAGFASHPFAATTTTDDEGRFLFDPEEVVGLIAEDDVTLLVGASSPGHRPLFEAPPIIDGVVDVTLVLARGGVLVGSVVLDGAPRGGSVGVRAVGPDSRVISSPVTAPAFEFKHQRAEYGEWSFMVEVDDQQSEEIAVEWSGEPVVLRPRFTTPTWVVDVEAVGQTELGTADEREAGVAPQLVFGAVRSDPQGVLPGAFHAVRNDGGRPRFVFGPAWNDADDVWIYAACDGELLDVKRVRRGDTRVALDIPVDAGTRRGGLVVDVTSLMDDGAMAPPVATLYELDGSTTHAARFSSRSFATKLESSNPLARFLGFDQDEERTFQLFQRLRPGHYELAVRPIFAGSSAAFVRDIVVEPGRVTHVTPTARPTAEVSFAVPAAGRVTRHMVVFDERGRARVRYVDIETAFNVLLPDGRYTVAMTTTDGRYGQATFDVAREAAQRVTIPLEPASLTTLTFSSVEGSGHAFRVAVTDANGRVIVERGHFGVSTTRAPLTLSLPAGHYGVEVSLDGQVVASDVITVNGVSPANVELTAVR